MDWNKGGLWPFVYGCLVLIVLFAAFFACCHRGLSQQPQVVTAQPTLFYGAVEGHVLSEESNVSLPGTSVWIVNATSGNVAYGPMKADRGGYFNFLNVAPIGPAMYRLKAQADSSTGYSWPFVVGGMENKKVDVYVRMKPAKVMLSMPRSYVVANDSDCVTVTARAKDSFGNPVASGFPFSMTIQPGAEGELIGSIGARGPVSAVHNISTDGDGSFNVDYGWAKPGAGGKFAILKVYSDDDPAVNASVVVDVRSVDTTPPNTTVSVSGVNYNEGAYSSNVTVRLTAVDNPGGWGVNATYYRLDGKDWVPYNGRFTISTDGAHTLEYYSVDKAGNAEKPKLRVILIHRPA